MIIEQDGVLTFKESHNRGYNIKMLKYNSEGTRYIGRPKKRSGGRFNAPYTETRIQVESLP